jgi:hypothetical protein
VAKARATESTPSWPCSRAADSAATIVPRMGRDAGFGQAGSTARLASPRGRARPDPHGEGAATRALLEPTWKSDPMSRHLSRSRRPR